VLKNKINDDLKKAMLAREESIISTLRSLKGAILEVEVAEGKRESGLSDEEIERILQREVKKRKESIEIYRNNGRDELADEEQAEVDIFEGYLPKQMTDEEIVIVIDEVLKGGNDEAPNVGKVIGAVKATTGSRADGARVAKLVQERLK
jgi:uncharacterized protein YqeY